MTTDGSTLRRRAAVTFIVVAAAVGAAWALGSSPSSTELQSASSSSATASTATPTGVVPTNAPPPTMATVITPVACPSGMQPSHVNFFEGAGSSDGCMKTLEDGGHVAEGDWTVHNPNGSTTSGPIVHGQREGRWTTTYPSGAVMKTEDYDHDLLDGWQIEWSEDGKKLAEREWHEGMLDGPVTLYHPNGEVVHEVWRKGMRVDPPLVPPGDAWSVGG